MDIAYLSRRCNATNVRKDVFAREHDVSIENFQRAAKKCVHKGITDGCNDNRNPHKYCRWWACPLTEEE